MRVLVLGVGNRFRGDDGLGSCLAEVLAEEVDGVDVVDGNARGLKLVEELEGYDYAVFIDVMEGLAPGEVSVFDLSEGDFDIEIPITSHRLPPTLVLSLARRTGIFTGRAYLIAVGPRNLGFAEMPSEEVVGALPRVVEHLVDLLRRAGVEARVEVDKIVKGFLKCYRKSLLVKSDEP